MARRTKRNPPRPKHLIRQVSDFFGSADKAATWFATPNPQLGGLTPDDLITLGRLTTLEHFVQASLAENQKENATHPNLDQLLQHQDSINLVRALRAAGCRVASYSAEGPACVSALMRDPIAVGMALACVSYENVGRFSRRTVLSRQDGWYYCYWPEIPWPEQKKED